MHILECNCGKLAVCEKATSGISMLTPSPYNATLQLHNDDDDGDDGDGDDDETAADRLGNIC